MFAGLWAAVAVAAADAAHAAQETGARQALVAAEQVALPLPAYVCPYCKSIHHDDRCPSCGAPRRHT